MRVIEAFDEPVRAVAVSPDGRFLAAAAGFGLAVWDLLTHDTIVRVGCPSPVGQMAFTADGNWVLFSDVSGLYRLATGPAAQLQLSRAAFAGGVAVAPDGKMLAATFAGPRQSVRLSRWELPAFRAATGFDFWSPFARLGFSPNGEFLAGIDSDTFELRIAVTGGLNGRHRIRSLGDGYFFAFARDSQTVVFGWGTDLHVMETRAGTLQRSVPSPVGPFLLDAAFLGSGRLLTTVDGSDLMRVWSAEWWEVEREYDWEAGGLTCTTVAPDGLSGVCGTDAGRVIVFDVDE